jgi:hypothetical protein
MAVLSIDITSRELFAGGQAFGEGGAYEEIKGTLTYGVDPEHAANAGIVDLQYAPGTPRARCASGPISPSSSPSMTPGATAGC